MPVWKYMVIDGGSPGTQNIFSAVLQLPDLSVTATKMRYSGVDEVVSVFQGTGIVSNMADEVTAGTITAMTVRGSGDLALTATGLNLSAKSIFDKMALDDSFGLAQLMFSGRDTIYGTSFGEDLFGFNAKDRIFGGGGADFERGGNGNDSLYGGAGKDMLDGGNGINILSGGAGKDTLLGTDSGTDRFVFDRAIGPSNVDTIVDFNALNNDRILFDNDIFKALGGPGALAPGRFRAGTAATDAGDRIIYDDATGKLFYDRDGTGAAGQKLIAVLGGDSAGPVLTAADFEIIN
jgi:Ca2+-binding RTX toxin-like protein